MSKPKIMTILIVQVNASDYHTEYGSNKDIENAVFGGQGPDAKGEIKGSFAHMLKHSTYGRVTAPRAASAVITVQTGKPQITKDGKVTKETCAYRWKHMALKQISEQSDIDLDVFDFRMFFLSDHKDQTRKKCGWFGLASNACGPPVRLPIRGWLRSDKFKHMGQPREKCDSWYYTNDPVTISHELGHNLGLGHAVGQGSTDGQAVMASNNHLTDYMAANRYQMGTLKLAPGEMTEYVAGKDKAKHFKLRAISTEYNAKGAFTALRIPCPRPFCPKAKINNDGPSDYNGGDFIVSFRDDKGYSASLSEPVQNRVFVHHKYGNSNVETTYRTYYGFGTVKYARLSPGGKTFTHAKLGVAIQFCGMDGDLADISVAPTEAEAKKGCPGYGKATTMPKNVATRCTNFEPMAGKMIDGINYNWRYETFQLAKIKCHKEEKCTGIYQSKPGALFEVRMGKTYNSHSRYKDGKSWACFGYLPNGKIIASAKELKEQEKKDKE